MLIVDSIYAHIKENRDPQSKVWGRGGFGGFRGGGVGVESCWLPNFLPENT